MADLSSGWTQRQWEQKTSNLQMRGAQIAADKQGVKFDLEPQPKAQGSKKQLVGTIVGIAAVVVLLLLLKALNVI